MVVLRRASGKNMEKRVERLGGGAKMEVRESHRSYSSRLVLVEKFYLVKEGQKKIKNNQYCLMVGLQLEVVEPERVSGELEENRY